MRGSLVTLLVVSALASVLLAVWYVRRSDSYRSEPPMTIARTPDRIEVLAGGNEEIELLLRAYLPENGQDAFNRERLDQMLGLKNPGLDYLRLWIVNRSDRAIPFEPTKSTTLSLAASPDWRARSLASLIEERLESISRADLFVLDGLARRDLDELAPRAFVEVVVALPRNPAWTTLDGLRATELLGVTLHRAEVAPDALDRFLAQPQGELLDRLVVPASAPDSLQASRK